MSIQVVCTQCGKKLIAPDQAAGKKGKCPDCGTVFQIPAPNPSQTIGSLPQRPRSIIVDETPSLDQSGGFPRNLYPGNLYLILSSDKIVAYHKDHEGWMLHLANGYMAAAREPSHLPLEGFYTFIEGNVKQTEEGRRLVGAQFFQIEEPGALRSLAVGNDMIFEFLTRRISLSYSQKKLFLQFIREQYFSAFTDRAVEVMDFLLGEDYHSQRVGECECPNIARLRG